MKKVAKVRQIFIFIVAKRQNLLNNYTMNSRRKKWNRYVYPPAGLQIRCASLRGLRGECEPRVWLQGPPPRQTLLSQVVQRKFTVLPVHPFSSTAARSLLSGWATPGPSGEYMVATRCRWLYQDKVVITWSPPGVGDFYHETKNI